MRSKYPAFSKETFLLLLALVPVVFINITPEHSFGDDFAAYINQAFAVLHHIPQDQTGYIFNPDYPDYAPPSYSVGFPLLLAPVIAVFGQDFVPLKIYIGLFIIATALVMFYFFRKKIGTLNAFVVAIVWTYSPWLLNFKSNILSDIPFTLFFIWSLLLFSSNKENRRYAFYAGLLSGIAMCIRPVGIVTPVAVIMYGFVLWLRERDWTKTKTPLLFSAIALIFYFLVNNVLFPVSTEQLNHFGGIVSNFSLPILKTNFEYYHSWQAPPYLTFNGLESAFLTTFSLYFFQIAIVGGFLYKFFKQPDAFELVALFYIIAVLVFPGQQGFRYFLPLTPFFFFYLFYLGESILMLKYFLPIIILITWMAGILSYTPIALNDDNICKSESVAMFNFVKDSLPGQEPVLFEKPRALVMRTQRKAIPFSNAQTKEQNKKWIVSHHCKYAVLFKWDDHSHFDIDSMVYTNNMFDIVQIRK